MQSESQHSNGRRRKIVFANRYFYPDESATSQMLTDLARRLVGAGLEIHIVASRQLYADAGASLAEIECVDGVRVHRVWTSRFGRDRLIGRALDYASFYLVAGWTLWRLVRTGDILVAKTDPPMFSILGAVVAKLRRAHLINWLQDVFPEVATQLSPRKFPLLGRMLMACRDASLRAACVNVVLGARMRDYLAARGIAKGSLWVIENWAHAIAGSGREVDNKLRSEQRWLDKFVVMYSGNLGRAHEYDTMLGAARLLRDRDDIVFAMVGGGVKMQAMRVAAASEGLCNMTFLPYQPRESLEESLTAADVHLVCLLPQLEGFVVPSKFYGILAAGRPSIFIGDPRGELAIAIREADCGGVVSTADAQSLKDHILTMRDRPDLVVAQGRRARNLFEQRYTLDAAVLKWLAAFERTAPQTTAARPAERETISSDFSA